MSNYSIHTISKGYIAVPVTDDEDNYTYWDVHNDTHDWSSEDPIITAPTLTEARTMLSNHLRQERRTAGLLRFGN